MTPEKKVKNKVVAILKKFGAYYFYPVMSGYGVSGVPDIIVCYKSRFVAIEVKATPKNKPTTLQQKNIDKINYNGGIAIVVHCDNIESVTETLEEINLDGDRQTNR